MIYSEPISKNSRIPMESSNENWLIVAIPLPRDPQPSAARTSSKSDVIDGNPAEIRAETAGSIAGMPIALARRSIAPPAV